MLREDKTKRSVLNAPLFDKMTHQLVGEKQLRFQSLDLKGKMATFTLKVSNKKKWAAGAAVAGNALHTRCFSCSMLTWLAFFHLSLLQFKQKSEAQDVDKEIDACLQRIKA